MIDSKRSVIEILSELMLEKLTKNKSLERVDYLKCKLGIEILLSNLSKLSVIYVVAMIMGLAIPVFIFHLAYISIRSYAYGAHSESSLTCTAISCLILIGIPFVLGFMQMPRIAFIILYTASHFILEKYAPAVTKKNGLMHANGDRKEKLKVKVLKMNFIVFTIAFLIPNLLVGNLIMFGTFIASLMVTPLSYKLLKNEGMDV